MRIRTTIRRRYGQIRRWWSALRARLRRERAALGLLTALLAVGVGEPLLCIAHCQIWIPLVYHSYFAAQHQHVHHDHHTQPGASAASPAAAAPARGVALMVSHTPASDPGCLMPHMSGSGDGVPYPVPPAPSHDLLLALLTLFFAVMLLHVRPAAPPGDPPGCAWPPPLRPPIPFAR